MEAIRLGYDYARKTVSCPLANARQAMDRTSGNIIIDGNTAAGLGLHVRGRDGWCLVSDYTVDVTDGCIS